ncbi:hypothetical protein QUC31_020882 [Theobroma cacao]
MTGSSALMAIGHIFFCYILFFSFHANKPFVYGTGVVEKQKSRALPGPARGLKVFHRFGPSSPSGHKKSSATSSRVLVQDERRVKDFYSTIYNRERNVRIRAHDPHFGHTVGAGNYIIEVRLGTPARTFNLILDTGSYATWVRCQPCLQGRCPEQQEKMYYPSCSSTYLKAPCWPSCNYSQSYYDKSYSSGFFVLDTLAIEPFHVPNFAFLCAQNYSESFGEASGILALGQGSTSTSEPFGVYSLVSQTATTFDKVFCHCLPTAENSAGYVYFGKEALEKCQNSGTYTPLLTNPGNPSLYYVNLIAITIGKQRLEMPSVSSPRTIIDSGTVISRLPSSVYSKLSSEFKELMSNYPVASSDGILDTCYDLQGHYNYTIPKMVLHFENLDVNLDQIAVTWRRENSSRVCLAFAGADDLTIIGSEQLQKLNVLYNIQDRKVGIEPGNC